MSVSLLQLVSEWLGIICISAMSIMGFGNYDEKKIDITNANNSINVNVINYVEKHDTIIKYNSKIPKNISKIITEGVDGITYTVLDDYSENVKQKAIGENLLQEAVTEVIEQGTGAYGIYTGRLTGYSAACGAGCSGEGYLACKTESKERFSLKYDGIYYTDDEYGKVRILSAANSFPCGTIVEISNKTTKTLAVVMDRGGTMNTQWAKGLVYMDLAYESNELVGSDGITGKNIKFSVQRWGW
ncbi:MAG: G5 domain-containing protein [Bacilli bacterium]|nr:G5 domain-containing protein [Bacilli bacterium]